MLAGIRAIVTRPRDAFADREPSLGPPAIAVFLLGVLALVGAVVPAYPRFADLLPQSGSVTVATQGGAVSVSRVSVELLAWGVVGPFILWTMTAAFVFVLVGIVDVGRRVAGTDPVIPTAGDSWIATLRTVGLTIARAGHRTAVAIGWGYVPQLAATGVATVVFLGFLGANPSTTRVGIVITAAGHTTVHAPDVPAVTFVTHAVGAICTCWSGYVWVGALQSYRELSRRAALAVVLPVVALAIFLADLAGHVGIVT